MDIRTSIFAFLRTEQLTQVGDFSPLIDSGATIDNYNVHKLFSCYQPHTQCFSPLYKLAKNRNLRFFEFYGEIHQS